MNIKVLGIDLAKDVFQLHGVDDLGRAVLKKQLRRAALMPFIANLPVCRIAMEACSGAHYWGREFQEFGHEVLLISPQFVKPFVKTNKNDANDAEAIVEAACRPSMRFVPVKALWQQEVQHVHRVRQRLVRNRTALVNEIRGILTEHGIVMAKSVATVLKQVPKLLAQENENAKNLSRICSKMILGLMQEVRDISDRINFYEVQLKEFFKENEGAQRIEKIEGVGLITSTAIVAAMGDPKNFKNGRHFAAWLGLVPRQSSSGGKTTLLGISKRGDGYLRSLLIHGARAALARAPNYADKKSKWITEKSKTRGFNKACVALANRNARVIWALIAKRETYQVVTV